MRLLFIPMVMSGLSVFAVWSMAGAAPAGLGFPPVSECRPVPHCPTPS